MIFTVIFAEPGDARKYGKVQKAEKTCSKADLARVVELARNGEVSLRGSARELIVSSVFVGQRVKAKVGQFTNRNGRGKKPVLPHDKEANLAFEF